MDRLDAHSRSENMRRIRSKDTKPELLVRGAVHKLGYRYRLHRRDLPGCPDLVFATKRKVIFVHGCFWHQHGSCREGRPPSSNQSYWNTKLARTVARDRSAVEALLRDGWGVLTLWECELVDDRLDERLDRFLR